MERAYLLGMLACIAGSLHCAGPATTESGSSAASTTAQSAPAAGSKANVCALLTESEIAEVVGNPVRKGVHPDIGAPDCKWDVDTQGDVTVLLIVYRTGSIQEQSLCPDLRKSGKASGFEGVADASTWKFGSVAGLFNSGEFESCGSKGFISLQLNGKRDEARLKQATAALMARILGRLEGSSTYDTGFAHPSVV